MNRPHDGAEAATNQIDFSSNDYLGLARESEQTAMVASALTQADAMPLGATGSRLLSGDSLAHQQLEDYLAMVHCQPAALLCNSGYDANLSVVSSLTCDCIIYDEYIHNSLHMGLRLWKAKTSSQGKHDNNNKTCASFLHNDLNDLQKQLQSYSNHTVVVVVESVYSMDGDIAPLRQMLNLCQQFHAMLVVDEAHGLGFCGGPPASTIKNNYTGTGVLARENVQNHPNLHCSIHTFGKAAGCHGAVVCGSKLLKQYLVNYAYPFIYSTALPPHSLVVIKCAYETMTGPRGDALRDKLNQLITLFRKNLTAHLRAIYCPSIKLLASNTPIQALMVPGNEQCTQFCQQLYAASTKRIVLYPIKTPTVPAGQERVRIIIHAHNTVEQVLMLVDLIKTTLNDMALSRRHDMLLQSKL
ncbi:hypothetical protein MPSEU_000463500 [Mayamaea pseudoterrestris]|nr:hypothetical protein MPSEU_000463500 [Mayamaea pseudoterrestris]